MKQIVLAGMAVVMAVALSGCGNGIKIIKPVENTSSIGVVPFTDCNTGEYTDCGGSGKKVAEMYGKVLGAPVVAKEDAGKFDVLLTGDVLEYNIAHPMLFRPNMVAVDLKMLDKVGSVLVTQKRAATENNLFGSAESCNKKLAEALKEEIGR